MEAARAPKAAESERRPFYWWRGTDLLYFASVLVKALLMDGPQNVRMEFHPSDEMLRLFALRDGKWTLVGEYNDAHKCPIDCPNGNGGQS